ncbi:MAG TPA: DUF3604 domain-containing protein [Candidatus Limnocylindria bacterium]|nr:DUF3604 domain-containing protein [Candidatus Limnocylindria bacterium]
MGARVVAVLVLLAAGTAAAGDVRAPCAERDPLRRPYFGDLHVHTALSFDAAQQGTRNTPRDAYRFARGEAVGVQPYAADGTPLRTVRLRRPLDFAAVTDHAELLGETRICTDPSLPGHDALVCRLTQRWPWLAYMLVASQMLDVAAPRRYGFCGDDGAVCREAMRGPWQEIQTAAEEAYDRSAACRFTTFIAYEWSGDPDGHMVHRNVIFRNATVPPLPANFVDDRTAPRLWQRLRAECIEAGTGCDALVIPHNANLSGGLLFGPPADAAEARVRAGLEVLLEVTQHKGDSECRRGVGLTDEDCGFETLDFGRMRESAMPWERTDPPPMSYAREILAAGLAHEARLGVNPYKVGLVGSTDTHLGTPGLVDEDRFVGHAAGIVTSRLEVPPLPDDARLNPGGLVVAWAEENSREALFAALRRREAYSTSGPRLAVRFFGGWDYPADACERPDLAAVGYAGGVPMGGDLPAAHVGQAPMFIVSAAADAGTADHPGMPLERLQIVKLWHDGRVAHQRVFDVAGARGAAGGVDPATCRPRADGPRSLCALWRDPEFDAERSAVYYARVLEQPSCRWTAWECLRARVDCTRGAPAGMEACCDPAVPRTIRERAVTSPIWYAGRSSRSGG